MERKLLIKDGIQVYTGQAIRENHFKEMIDTLTVIRKPLKWFQEESPEKNLHLCHTNTVVRGFDLPEDFPMNYYHRNKETLGFHLMRFKTKPFIGFKIDQTISCGCKSIAKWETNFTVKRLTYTALLPIVNKRRPLIA